MQSAMIFQKQENEEKSEDKGDGRKLGLSSPSTWRPIWSEEAQVGGTTTWAICDMGAYHIFSGRARKSLRRAELAYIKDLTFE